MNRKCRKAEKWLGPYLDRELAESRRRWLEDHLQTCSACHRELELHRVLSRGSRAAGKDIRRDFAPGTIWPRLRIELERSSSSSPAGKKQTGSFRRWIPAWAGAGLAVAAIILLVAFLSMFKMPTTDWSAISSLNAPHHSVLIYQDSEIVFIWLTEES